MNVDLIQGDALDALRKMPTASIGTTITSPPYWRLRDYGAAGQIGLEDDPSDFVERLAEVFAEVHRLTRPTGTLWLNVGDTYFGDSPTRASGTASFSERWDKSQTRSRGGARRSAARLRDLKPKDLVGIPWEIARRLRADGWFVRSEIVLVKEQPRPEGRAATDRPTRAHETLFLMSKSRKYDFNAAALPHTDVWPYRADRLTQHPAAMPIQIARWCVAASAGTVLDPFAGSGTTLMAAAEAGRDAVGIDLVTEDAEARLAQGRLLLDADEGGML